MKNPDLVAMPGGGWGVSAGSDRASASVGLTSDCDLLIHLNRLTRYVRHQLDEELRKIGQDAARMETLLAIASMPGASSQIELARHLGLGGATITRMVDLLCAEDLVERRPHPSDRRLNLLSITSLGEQVLATTSVHYKKVCDHVLHGVPELEAQQLALSIHKLLTGPRPRRTATGGD